MLNVLDWLRSRTPHGRKASELYGSIVTLARAPSLYSSAGVPDTPNGRYEMVVLHTAFALQALKRQAEEATADAMARAVVERFVTDMDDSLRQLAVGDMAVPRKVKKAAAGLKERVAQYAAAAGSADPVTTLQTALSAHIWPSGPPSHVDLRGLARYAHAGLTLASVNGPSLEGVPGPQTFLGGPALGSAEA